MQILPPAERVCCRLQARNVVKKNKKQTHCNILTRKFGINLDAAYGAHEACWIFLRAVNVIQVTREGLGSEVQAEAE